MNKEYYESPETSMFILTQEGVLCSSPEPGQTESIEYEDLFGV